MNNIHALRSVKMALHERERWWPEDLGTPATFGSSEHLRYASFPLVRRLVIERDGTLSTYDMAHYQFRGVLQFGGPDGKMSFLSQHGRVALTELAVVE